MPLSDFLLRYARKGTVAALTTALPVLSVALVRITQDGSVSLAEAVTAAGAVAASAVSGFVLVFKAENTPPSPNEQDESKDDVLPE